MPGGESKRIKFRIFDYSDLRMPEPVPSSPVCFGMDGTPCQLVNQRLFEQNETV